LHNVPITFAEILVGKALKVYINLDEGKQESYQELKPALVQKLVLKDNPILVRSKYNKRRQAQNETVQEFFYDLLKLGSIAHPDYSKRQLESDVLYHFVDGLKADIRKFVLSIEIPNSLNECLQKAKNVESANLDESSEFVVNSIHDRRKLNSVPKLPYEQKFDDKNAKIERRIEEHERQIRELVLQQSSDSDSDKKFFNRNRKIDYHAKSLANEYYYQSPKCLGRYSQVTTKYTGENNPNSGQNRQKFQKYSFDPDAYCDFHPLQMRGHLIDNCLKYQKFLQEQGPQKIVQTKQHRFVTI